MKKDVLIEIKGSYFYDNAEPDVIELFTTGTYSKTGNNYVISYDESSATGFEGSTTTLEINDDTITMSRVGEEANAQLIIQDGVRHQCWYDAGYGDMTIGVNGHMLKHTLGKNGGDLHFKYSLDVNSMLASENEMTIKIKERVN